MPQWKPIVGLGFEPAAFDIYCKQLTWMNWRPSFVVVHNTSTPDLAMRPKGFTHQHMLNLVSYYRDQQGWSAGPHLFVDDHQIWVFTPLTTTGRHSPSWNSVALGVEMLGNFQTDDFNSGRGAVVRQNAVCAVTSICGALGLSPATTRFHKEDPMTTHKDCPGKNCSKSGFIQDVQKALLAHYDAEHVPEHTHP